MYSQLGALLLVCDLNICELQFHLNKDKLVLDLSQTFRRTVSSKEHTAYLNMILNAKAITSWVVQDWWV